MLSVIFLSAILAGVDNLQACSALGLLPLTSNQRRWYAVCFATAETVAPLIGLSLGGLLWPRIFHQIDMVSPLILLICGLAIVALALMNRDVTRWFGRPGMMAALPVLLSVDNLLAGLGLSAAHAPVPVSALIIGLTGAAMSCAGIYLGGSVRGWVPKRAELAAGVAICVVSLRLWMKG